MCSHNKFLCFIIYYFMMLSQSDSTSNIRQSYFYLCNEGFEFSPFNQQLLFLFETTTKSIRNCAQACLYTDTCRTFNFDGQTNNCRLYEGDIDSTGLIVSSLSSQSKCGSVKLMSSDFIDYGRPCSYCENSRSLTCVNGSCQCQSHTYYDGSICRSQKLNGSACTNDIQCRNDVNLTCLSNMQCGYNSALSYTTTTTTVSSSTSTSSSTTSTSTTTSTTTTITTTTRLSCGSSCLNQTWTSTNNCLARWLFDGNYLDQMNNYNTTPSNTMSFTSNAYVKQALIFSNNTSPMLNVPYIPLSNTSFTFDMWLYITGFEYTNINHNALFGLCIERAPYRCLHITIRSVNGTNPLHIGFYAADCTGITSLSLNTWIHAAFVFDAITLIQQIYINGVLDNTCNASSTLNVTTTNGTIGFIPYMSSTGGGIAYYQGYLDQMTISNRVKSSCEVLEIATLVAYFTFDSGSFLIDSGPNSLIATTQSTLSTLSGRFSQAITFNGSSTSYFQIAGFVALGKSNKSFSISLWLRPVSLSGVVVHVSSTQYGNGWCLPYLGFTINGSFAAQIYNGSTPVAVISPILSLSTSVWSHVVQTWSSINGLRLYINNILVASSPASTTPHVGSGAANYIFLANGLNSTLCSMGAINNGTYKGDMDDFRVYSRELSASDVCTLYTN